MSPSSFALLANLVLAVHFGIILFNIFGLVAVPLGSWLGWRFVRVRWWRVLHLLSLLVVAAQAVAGRACFLTLWQVDLEGGGEGPARPMILEWVNRAMYWHLPPWVFVAFYLAALAYAALLWRWVPPARTRGRYLRSMRR